MDTASFAREFTELYRAVYVRFHRRDRVEAYRLSPESLAILRHLDASGPLTVKEAMRHFERSQSATSELISRLEKRGILAVFHGISGTYSYRGVRFCIVTFSGKAFRDHEFAPILRNVAMQDLTPSCPHSRSRGKIGRLSFSNGRSLKLAEVSPAPPSTT